MTTKEFIKKRPHLIWSTRDFDSLSDEPIVEAVLNYGNWEDVQTLFNILGIKKAAKIFKEQTRKNRRVNYRPEVVNYFKQYFKKYA